MANSLQHCEKTITHPVFIKFEVYEQNNKKTTYNISAQYLDFSQFFFNKCQKLKLFLVG